MNEKIFLIGLVVIGCCIVWTVIGSFAIGGVDKNLELTNWKMKSPSWVVFIATMLWPIIVIAYSIRNIRMK